MHLLNCYQPIFIPSCTLSQGLNNFWTQLLYRAHIFVIERTQMFLALERVTCTLDTLSFRAIGNNLNPPGDYERQTKADA